MFQAVGKQADVAGGGEQGGQRCGTEVAVG